MAEKREIVADIRSLYGNTMSQNQVREYLNCGHDQIRDFLADVPFIQDARKKRFLAIDIAKKIHDQQQTIA